MIEKDTFYAESRNFKRLKVLKIFLIGRRDTLWQHVWLDVLIVGH